MSPSSALPFTFRRKSDVVTALTVTSTHETVHGLLRLAGDKVVLQWRTSRKIEHVGFEVRTDREIEGVREIALPLSAIADAAVRWSWLRWPPGRYLILTGSDLRAFEQLAGEGGLRMRHPAEIAIRVGRVDQSAAADFAVDLRLALADRAIEAAERIGITPGEAPDPPLS